MPRFGVGHEPVAPTPWKGKHAPISQNLTTNRGRGVDPARSSCCRQHEASVQPTQAYLTFGKRLADFAYCAGLSVNFPNEALHEWGSRAKRRIICSAVVVVLPRQGLVREVRTSDRADGWAARPSALDGWWRFPNP